MPFRIIITELRKLYMPLNGETAFACICIDYSMKLTIIYILHAHCCIMIDVFTGLL